MNVVELEVVPVDDLVVNGFQFVRWQLGICFQQLWLGNKEIGILEIRQQSPAAIDRGIVWLWWLILNIVLSHWLDLRLKTEADIHLSNIIVPCLCICQGNLVVDTVDQLLLDLCHVESTKLRVGLEKFWFCWQEHWVCEVGCLWPAT